MTNFIPLDQRDGFIWLDGQLTSWADARIHILTHGLHYGSCVFEGERTYGGIIFKSRLHSQRLHDSAEQMGFRVPYSLDQLEQAKADVLKKNNLADAYIRAFAWRGSEALGISAPHNRIRTAIAAWDWPSYFSPELKAKGIRLKLSRWRRPAPNTAPTAAKAAGLYMICTISKHEAEAEGFQDALMLDYRGLLAEATGANLFLVMDGQLHTPKPDCFLNGITRQTVMDLARARGMTVVERFIDPHELGKASEIFLTGTAAEITPVGHIDMTGEGGTGQTYDMIPASVTRTLSEDYSRLVRG